MDILSIGVGLRQLAFPAFCALCVIAVWVINRNKAIRIFTIVASAITALAIYVVDWKSALGNSASYDEFLSYCRQFTTGEQSQPSVTDDQIMVDFDTRQYGSMSRAERIGSVVFPTSVADRVLLGGFPRYTSITELAGAGHRRKSLAERGGWDDRYNPEPSSSRYGFVWSSNTLDLPDRVDSATLQIIERETQSVLGEVDAFVWLGPSGDSFPYSNGRLGAVRNRVVDSCPQPTEIAAFIKRVVTPPVRL